MRNIRVMQESSVGPALSMNFDMRKDVRDVFMAKKETLLSLANVHAVNEKGKAPSISTELITILLMWKRLTLDCRNGESRFATIRKNGAMLRNNATAIPQRSGVTSQVIQ